MFHIKSKCKYTMPFFSVFFMVLAFASKVVFAASVNIDLGNGAGTQSVTGQVDPALQILFIVTIIGLAPTILLMLTCFTRIIICLHFLRTALGTQQMPPNQVIIGLALFLTFFLMGPTFTTINDNAVKPYTSGKLTTMQAVDEGMKPIREFMFRQVENQDLELFTRLDGKTYKTQLDIPNRVLIPAFILGEITKGFKFGFIVFIPFLVIDMIVSSILMAMGMMMLPPSMISLPFKILFFVMVNGWSLVVGNIIQTFR